MDHLHVVTNRHDTHSDAVRCASDHRWTVSPKGKKDAWPDSDLFPEDIVPGTRETENIEVSVAIHGIPLPIDLFVASGEHLNVQDWPRFFSTNKAINAIYQGNKIGYAKSLSKIGSALRLSEILEALSAIAQYGADKQPYLLRAFAENIRRKTHGPAYGATKEWQEQIDAQFDWHDAQPSGADRDLALQRLIIARGFALADDRSAHKEKNLQSIIANRLDSLSPAYWPPIFEALLPVAEVRSLFRDCGFKDKFVGHIPSISLAFSLLIAVEFVNQPHDYPDICTLLHDRFGVNETCLHGTLAPLVADAIAANTIQLPFHQRNVSLMRIAQRWRRDDRHFGSLVTDAFIKSFDAAVYRKKSFSKLLNEDFSAIPGLHHRVRARTIFLEGPTIRALRETAEKPDAQRDAFLKMIDRIGDRPIGSDYTKVLRDIIAMPLVTQPALLHRLVSNAQIGWNYADIANMFVSAAIDCRNTLMSARAQNSHLVGRVSAALILVANALRKYNTRVADELAADASNRAFLYVAQQDWGDVLEALIFDCTHDHYATVEKWASIDKHTALFTCDPDASARHLPELSARIEEIVGTLWHRLPDKADSERSRFDVFKQRIGIRPGMGNIALASIATSLVRNVVAGEHLLEAVATAASFDDPGAIAALETALFEYEIRPLLRADSDIEAITNQYTKQSLYLRSLIAEAVYDFGIRSDVVNKVA